MISIVVPVYNRPGELRELLKSIRAQTTRRPFEVVVVEDGSADEASEVVRALGADLDITYLTKPNTGPGDSRNYGMQRARGAYFVLVDSDCILPPDYLETLYGYLDHTKVDCLGGRDAADESFSPFQKAVSFCMTAPLTTGGLRGGKRKNDQFQPRSFNMVLSADAFRASGGFGNIHPGEDPDLSLRLRALGFRLQYLPELVVYHKRRIDLKAFFRQVYRFGLVRPILNRWHPGSARLAYWLPAFFTLGLLMALLLPFFGLGVLGFLPLLLYVGYMLLIGIAALAVSRSLVVGLLVLLAAPVQFLGYGLGFLKSQTLLTFSNTKPEALFPGLFFKAGS